MSAAPKKELSLFDSVCIIVGIIIGAGIYKTSPTVAWAMGSWQGILGVWLAGGALALAGALCYAELATAYPRQGGDYIYLNRAYGKWAGFLFGWAQLAIVRPGDIALLAFVFAAYAGTLHTPFGGDSRFYAAAAVVVLTGLNILGVKESKWTQNILTVAKALGLLAIVAIGMTAPAPPPPPVETATAAGFSMEGLKLALILVMFTYGGWNEMAYVAAEVKRPERNIVRALVFGTVAVAALYLAVNGAFLHALGASGMAASEAVATDTVAAALPDLAARAIAVLICISALGAVNGLIFTGARISYALGEDHALFRPLGKWNPRFGTPIWALLVQGALSLAMVLVLGTFLDTILYAAPVVWLFFLGAGLSVFILRRKEPAVPRPYRILAYPLPPIIFCAACVFMFYSCVTYAWSQKPKGLMVLIGVLLAGAVVYAIAKARDARNGKNPGSPLTPPKPPTEHP